MYSIVVKLADVNVRLALCYKKNISKFKNFITNGEVDCSLNISAERIDEERSIIKTIYPGDKYSNSDVEFNVIYRDLSIALFDYGVLIYHGVLIEKDGEGFLFTAPSGVGKSTLAKNWLKVFGNQVSIINGDKPLLRLCKDGLFGYGSPWKGKENYGTSSCVKIKAICKIQQGVRNEIVKLNVQNQAIGWLINGVMLKNRENFSVEIVRWLKKVLPFVSLYEFSCNTSEDSARISYYAMNNDAR